MYDIYLDKMMGHRLLTVAEEQTLLARVALGGNEGNDAMREMARYNARLVMSVAKRYTGRGLDFSDLVGEGCVGLMKAIAKFDLTRGAKFSTYAAWWIRQAVSRAVADQGRTIRLPVHIQDDEKSLKKTSDELAVQLGRQPTEGEVAKTLGVTVKKVKAIQMLIYESQTVSLDETHDNDGQEIWWVVDTTPDQQTLAEETDLTEALKDVLWTLPVREAKIIALRFGLVGGIAYTLEEVGEKFGITKERVRQLEGQALRRLRHPRRTRWLKDFVR